ncbi:MAG: RNA polymerase sigma factor [Bacteroidales bacterium]|nr:RNA polymerase sigma factor [Bacteroidales bacterium]
MENKNKTEFLKYYEPIHHQLYKYCRAISGNTVDAEDLIQDTILNVLERFDKIKDLSVFKSYVFSIASNLHKMKQRRNKFKASFNEEEINQIIDFGQNQEYYTEFKIVYEKILSLPAKTSETLILYHISDLSVEDIQKIQGGSAAAVRSRLQRGREKVLSLLKTKEQLKIAMMLLTI